jgi:hypothetical protein
VTDATAFQLSRVYAAGWSAANKLTADERDAAALEPISKLNPYRTDPQRARWQDGFRDALASAQRPKSKPHNPGR